MKKLISFFLLPLSVIQAQVDKDALPKVEDGFAINFFIKEPHVINATSLCFDKYGRLYVGAGPQYRKPREDSPTDYIKILIDEDNDGIAETVKTFAEGLNSVQAMAWKGNELWVANSPELTVLRDTDGDDVADEYQMIYTGLNNLRHGLHGLNWGPDGWLYMTMGNTWVKPHAPKPFRDLQGLKSDDKTEYPLTKVYTKDTYPKSYHPMNKSEKEGGVFRCRPGGHDLELYARGMRNPWDMCMDSGFNWLATDNDPGPPGERIFMPFRHGHFSMRHPWKYDWMGKHIAVAPASDLFPGTSGSGTGVAFYTSTHFPETYQNRYLIADWTNNCIFLYNPKWDGALQVPAEQKRKIVDGGVTRGGDLGYKGEKGRALFRPTDIEVGPDGALYIAGWGSVYGTNYVPKEKWTAEENAKYQGRVFRLRHEAPLIDRKKWDLPKRKKDINAWSVTELMEDIGQQVHVWRVQAQDELVRRGKSVKGDLLKALQSGKLNEIETTWSVWALGHIEKATGSDHSIIRKYAKEGATLNLRIQAARILGENQDKEASELLIDLLDDPEPRLRTAAMQALSNIGWGDLSNSVLSAISDETDRVAFYVSWQNMRRQMPKDQRQKLLDDSRGRIRLMAALGLMEEGDRNLQKQFDAFVRDSDKDRRTEGSGVTARIQLKAKELNFRDSTTISAAVSTSGPVDYEVRYTLDGSKPTAMSSRLNHSQKISKAATVQAGVFINSQLASDIASLHVHRITDSEWKDRLFVTGVRIKGTDAKVTPVDDGLQRGVVAYADDGKETITQVPDAIAGTTLIPTRKGDCKRKEADYMFLTTNLPATVYIAYDAASKVPDWMRKNFQKTSHYVTTSKGKKLQVYSRDYKAGTIVLGGNSGPQTMYQVYLSKTGEKKTSISAAQAALSKANHKKGEEIFFGRGTCFACHQVQGRGIEVGPDLQGIRARRDMNYVIQSTLEPDAYIVEGYQQTSLEMKDGRKLFGMIQEETALQIKLVLPTGQQVFVNPKDIKKRDDAKHSGMPASFAYTLSPQDVADVSAWIMTLPPAKSAK